MRATTTRPLRRPRSGLASVKSSNSLLCVSFVFRSCTCIPHHPLDPRVSSTEQYCRLDAKEGETRPDLPSVVKVLVAKELDEVDLLEFDAVPEEAAEDEAECSRANDVGQEHLGGQCPVEEADVAWVTDVTWLWSARSSGGRPAACNILTRRHP